MTPAHSYSKLGALQDRVHDVSCHRAVAPDGCLNLLRELSREELVRRAPRAMARLANYLRQDYLCLGYPMPNVSLWGSGNALYET